MLNLSKSYSSFDHRDLLKVIIWNDLGAKYWNFPLQNVSKYSITSYKKISFHMLNLSKSYSSFDHRDLLKVIIWNDLGAKYWNFPLQNVSKYSITSYKKISFHMLNLSKSYSSFDHRDLLKSSYETILERNI